MANTGRERITTLSATLKRQWLLWGLLPVTAAAAASIVLSAVVGRPLSEHISRAQEVHLEAAMALVAAAFLAGFWVEGIRTATDRIILKLAETLGKPLDELKAVDFRESVAAVQTIALEAHWTALLLGWAGAAVPLVAAVTRMPADHVAVVAIMSELYILYVLSRHHHEIEVVDAADSGLLADEAAALARFRAFEPTPMQRIGLFLGWRPTLEPEPKPKKKGKH